MIKIFPIDTIKSSSQEQPFWVKGSLRFLAGISNNTSFIIKDASGHINVIFPPYLNSTVESALPSIENKTYKVCILGELIASDKPTLKAKAFFKINSIPISNTEKFNTPLPNKPLSHSLKKIKFKPLSLTSISQAAKSAYIELSQKSLDAFSINFNHHLKSFLAIDISQISCEKKQISTLPYKYLRDDISSKSSDLKEILSNSSHKLEDFFSISKILSEETKNFEDHS